MATSEELLKQSYAANLDKQKATLEQNYNASNADLAEQQVKAQKQTDANLNRTAVEAQKQRQNYAETQGAYGLTSGAMAQARMAQNNQETANLTALRAQQQENDAQIERQRGQLKMQYDNAIREAQANNDYQLAQQLYAQAREREKIMENEQARRDAAAWDEQQRKDRYAWDEQNRQAQAIWNADLQEKYAAAAAQREEALRREAARYDAELKLEYSNKANAANGYGSVSSGYRPTSSSGVADKAAMQALLDGYNGTGSGTGTGSSTGSKEVDDYLKQVTKIVREDLNNGYTPEAAAQGVMAQGVPETIARAAALQKYVQK